MKSDPWVSASLWDLSGRQAVSLGVAASVLLVAGWRLFWFLTDDAFIAFRYVSNAMLGRGLVWNPEPFVPVEGYTSFLWVVLLLGVWAGTGIVPPESANVLSLLFGAGTLVLSAVLVMRIALPSSWREIRFPLLAVALAGILLNRTFLTWLSSGLETALYNFLLTAWIVLALAPARAARRSPGRRRETLHGLLLSTTAALAALARPDGILAVLVTPVLLAFGAARDEDRDVPAGTAATPPRRPWPSILGSTLVRGLPLAVVALHFLWRRSFYGYWLPNTHAAKVVAPWPEAGVRYAASFAVEYGVWLWALLAVVAAARWLFRGGRPGIPAMRTALVALVLAVHAGYYVGVVGGDHFEYRIFSHLIPLLFASAVALLPRVTSRPRTGLVLLVALVLVSLPIPWVHWDATRGRTTREETFQMTVPVADRFPPPIRAAVATWDRWQAWLQRHSICARHQEHKIFYQTHRRRLPEREVGSRISWRERPVVVGGSVGLIGWVLPHVAVLDRYGLNDPVIARHPAPGGEQGPRLMAHERRPPPGYIECFRPNVRAIGPRVRSREKPLTDEEIAACQARRNGRSGSG